MIHEHIESMRPNDHHYLKQIVNTLPENMETTADYLFLANISVAVQETLYFKLKQIARDEYNWINDSILEECKARLDSVIGAEIGNHSIEETIIHSSDDNAHKGIDELLGTHFGHDTQFRFTGRVDLVTDSTVWEFKCTSKLSMDHLLQVVIYAWLWKIQHLDTKNFKIYNIRTRELLSLNATLEDLNTIIIALLKGKFQKQETKSDEDFIDEATLNILFS